MQTPITTQKAIIVSILSILVSIFSFFTYFTDTTTTKVQAEVIQAINYTDSSITDENDIKYKSNIIIKYTVNNKEYQTQKDGEFSTYLAGDKIDVYVDENSPYNVSLYSNSNSLLIGIFFLALAIGSPFLSVDCRKKAKKNIL